MAQDLSPGKSACILAVVVGCFAILWPSIFYPMLKGSILPSRDDGNGCCHVLLDKDVNGVKLVLDVCNAVLKKSEKFDIVSNKLDNKAFERCRSQINSTCSIDIHNLLKDKIRLDPSYKSTLEQLRTVNSSFCLKYHFDINLDVIGVPHRLKNPDFISHSKYNRQERSPYLRPNAMHPALRERGRAVPQPHSPPPPPRERSSAPPPVIAAKKPPVPGVRPPMGGGSHVPSQKGSGPMGILMPLYTVGIVIFFVYTLTKLVCKKHDSNAQYIHDPEFHRLVFQNAAKESKRQTADVKSNGSLSADTSKLGDVEINRLRKRLAETEATMERIVKQMNLVSQSLSNPHDENSILDENSSEKPVVKELEEKESTEKCAEKQAVTKNGHSKHDSNEVNGLIQVVGMETSESCANGQPLKHSSVESTNKSSTPNNISKEIIADEIILPTNVPVNSKILITDASTRNVAEEPSVILESKVTLNVIVNDNNHEESQETDENNIEEDELDNENDDDDDDEDEEDISENDESGSSEQNSFEKDVPSTEL